MFNLATLLEDSAIAAPNRLAVISGEKRLTYQRINAMANQVANALSAYGLGHGDKIALSCPNVWFFPVIYYGILKIGATVVPLNIMFKPREISYHLMDSDAQAYFCFEGTDGLPIGQYGFAGFNEVEGCNHFFLITTQPETNSPYPNTFTFSELIQNQTESFETIQTDEKDTAVILYTSGTTGQPKGAELTHFNMVMNARLADTMYQKSNNDIHLVALPLFHSYGQSVQMNAGFYCQSTLVLLPRFTPEAALKAMINEKITLFSGVPTMYWALLNYDQADKFDLREIAKNLRLCKSGGSPMPLEVLRGFEEKFEVKIIEGYGLSETSPVASFNQVNNRRPGSIGFPVWGTRIRVIDEQENDVPTGELGEIIISGHCVMKGYYKRPRATADTIKKGWLHSGDLGRFDDDGFLYISDRLKDMILRGGFNIYPREIEEMLMTHSAISLCAVIGVPSDEHGEEVKAIIVLKEEANLTESELIEWCKSNMAAYKYPRLIEFRESLPMTATGKILKRELR